MKRSLCYLTALIAVVVACNSASNNQTRSSSGDSLAWKMGVALYSFNRHPLPEALSMAERAGAKYVEGFSFYNLGPAFNNVEMGKLDSAGIEAVKRMMAEKGITMTSMYVDGAKDLADWERFFKMAAQFSLDYIVCEPAKEHWDIIDSLAGIYKVKVAIHEHAKGISIYWHPDSVLAAIKGRSNIGACADLGHWARSGLDPAACLKMLEGHVTGMHLKDVDEKGNPKANDVDPGTGVIDFKAVFSELKRQGFKGYMQVECEHNFEDNTADVKEAIGFVRQQAAGGK